MSYHLSGENPGALGRILVALILVHLVQEDVVAASKAIQVDSLETNIITRNIFINFCIAGLGRQLQSRRGLICFLVTSANHLLLIESLKRV